MVGRDRWARRMAFAITAVRRGGLELETDS